jgi:pyridoxal phosphate enzyme (YggS family)
VSALAGRLAQVRARVAEAARKAGRDPASVKLLAIGKGFPAERIREAADAGQLAFGENRVQEAEAKIAALPALEWHLVGQLQRNKARLACELFPFIHSVDRAELAQALGRHAAALGRRVRVLVQVNLDEEPRKGGVAPSGAAALAREIASLPALELAGLMAIPRPEPDPEAMRRAFARLRELRDRLRLEAPDGSRLEELSMGMSDDFEVAIQEGATIVRVGSAIFGARSR